MRRLLLLGFLIFLVSCKEEKVELQSSSFDHYITVLGTAQDGGYPHIGCQRDCCTSYYEGRSKNQKVVSLGLVDKNNQKKFIFEATPDISMQLDDLERNHIKTSTIIDGVFLTHAHIGHYAGLMYFGREALGKKNVPVYAMPKMETFLKTNGPWSQLVDIHNIALTTMKNDSAIQVSKDLKVTPFLVPHRDEFSETVGYKIEGPNKSALFIPDINKWNFWKKNIVEEVKKVDYAFLDATFFKNGEINRPMSEVPHPFIEETISLFANETTENKNKVIFIHFNHTNPALQEGSKERLELEKLGFRFASEKNQYEL